ncbi:hypothetical protein L798_00258 [Zootermopsis nevadensis]|uniref:Uncharacterized protein n=1 Tax=Zootermopsis nevadensis TaxID=136037 RepID=A0A067QLJ3_ZOONE|nr:hypothetical protein L798_00258 [Zootermopsis nevadensis]
MSQRHSSIETSTRLRVGVTSADSSVVPDMLIYLLVNSTHITVDGPAERALVYNNLIPKNTKIAF